MGQPKLDDTHIGDVEAALYQGLIPGRRILLWYDDDDVYHEGMIGLVVGGTEVVLHTPDKDLYIEDVSCVGATGPTKIRGLYARHRIPRGLGAAAYRFREPITDEVIKRVIRKSLSLAEEEKGVSFTVAPPGFVTQKAERLTSMSFLVAPSSATGWHHARLSRQCLMEMVEPFPFVQPSRIVSGLLLSPWGAWSWARKCP